MSEQRQVQDGLAGSKMLEATAKRGEKLDDLVQNTGKLVSKAKLYAQNAEKLAEMEAKKKTSFWER
jgi:NADP-dependent 3-hydroxy acid dehydrogenase YdfG